MRFPIAEVLFRTSLATLVTAGVLYAAPLAAQETDEEADEPQTIGQYARHYRSYRRDIDTMRDLSFTNSAEIEAAYSLFMEYDPGDLTRGWFAHNAIVASRAPGFMDTVRDEANRSGRRAFLASTRGQPGYIWNLSSTTAAIDIVFDGLYEDRVESQAVGRILNDRAYAYMDTRYGSRLPADSAANASVLIASATPVESSTGHSYVVPYRAQNLVSRVLQLAAYLSLDGASGANLNASGLLMDDQETNQCLRWARLNLAQCIAASRTTAEEAYCTGKHGVDDVSDCWGWMVSTSFDLDDDEPQN